MLSLLYDLVYGRTESITVFYVRFFCTKNVRWKHRPTTPLNNFRPSWFTRAAFSQISFLALLLRGVGSAPTKAQVTCSAVIPSSSIRRPTTIATAQVVAIPERVREVPASLAAVPICLAALPTCGASNGTCSGAMCIALVGNIPHVPPCQLVSPTAAPHF